ncbi:Ig-like domain-containing protein [Staphylococcus simulans]|uniref:Ig-like domain-containing protein n=1 Tax=Staphylococcus simulans TaxID=1286 RepID=UPI003F807D13
MTASSPAPEAPITNASAPAPAANAHPVDNVEGVTEQVYSKSIPVYPKSDVAKTAKMQRGIYQARESLGLIVPAGKEFYIRQAQGSNEADLRVDLMTNDRLQVRNKTVSRDGSWTNISTGIDSAAFVRIPTGLNQQPVVEYYVQDNAGVTLPTYRKNGDKTAFDSDWAARDTSYGYVDGDKIAFLVPREDRERIANLGQDPGRWGFTDLDDMIGYYEDVINHYDKWVGLNDDINSVHYNVGQKYFTIADAHGPGLAYYSTNNMGSNNTSMSGYLEKGWLGLHEVGHGYDGAMTYDPKMDLIEVENNILANQYQTEVMGVNDGWLYEGNQEGVQKGFNDRLVTGDLSYANGGFRGRLDFMTKMVRLTGIEGFTDLWKGIRQEEADMANASKPFAQDVPRWINTYWLADNGINGTAYFDLYKINLPQTLKDQLDTYNNTYTYPLSLLINNPEEQQRLTQKLGLSTPYELVKSSDLADTSVRADAQVSLNLNGQTLPDNVKVSLMEGTQEVASAEVVDGKAVFPQVRAGVYKIVAPLSTTYALPESEYIVVKESGENQAVLNYPKNDDVQDSVTQTISLRGLSNFEFASANYNPDTKQIEFKQNAGQPHVYFTDEYAHMTIQKADGTNVLDKSYIGNQRLSSETQTFDLDYGDKVIVHHREPAARRVLVRNETKENVTVPLADQETVTYTLTDKGFIVDGETQTDANRRYDEAIQSDVVQVAAAIQAHPERDYRSQLFKVFQGVEYADSNIKAELMNILNPLVEAYRVDTPVVNPIEAGSTSISGTGEAGSTITVTFKNGQKAEVEVPENGQWTTQLPQGTTVEHNDVTQVFATGKHGTVSETVSVKALDTIAPTVPTINNVEAGTSTVSGTAEPSSTVTLTLADGSTKEVQTDEQGNWTAEFSTPFTYQAPIKAVSTDKAGNHSTEATQIVVDTTAPQTPVINKVEAGTNTVSGKAEPSSTVKLTLADGSTKEVVADSQGNWTAEFSTPFVYQAPIKAVSTDKAGNASQEATQVVEDTTAPQAPVVNEIKATDSSVSGTSEANALVTVVLADGKRFETRADAEGKWTVALTQDIALKGNEVITVTAKDSADNQSTAAESKVVPVEVKTEEPAGQPNTPSETEVPQDETDEVASETPDTTETAQPEENTESESSEEQPVETAPVDQNETPESDNSTSNGEESTCDPTPAPDSETSDNTGENAPDTPVDSNQDSTPATEPTVTNTEVSVENEVCEVPSEESEESVEDASIEAVEGNATTEQPSVEEPAPVTSESPVDVTEETSVATDNKVQEDVVNENEVAESETVQPDSNHQQAQEAEQSKVSETVEAVETTSTPSSSTSSPVTDENKGSDQTESHSPVAKSETVSETPKGSVSHVTKEKNDQQQTVQGQKVQDKQQTKDQDKVLPATGQQEQSSSSIGWIASLFGAALIGRFARKKAKEDK